MAALSSIPQCQNLETFTLVWLDSLVNISQENIDTKVLLRNAINNLQAFDDSDKCVEYIQLVSEERIVLIVSGRLGREVVPRIHQLPHLIAIYVYCTDKKRNEEWANNYMKIKDVIVDLTTLITRIQSDQSKRNEYKIDEPLPISFFHTKTHQKKSSRIDNDNFIHLQVLIDCLSRMKSTLKDKNELISLCENEYNGNQTELNVIHEFEEKYSEDRAIWWFTRESFVCRMLNKAFQVINIDLLYHLHFFIRDIREQLIENKCSSVIHTYRAQLMSNEEIQALKDSIGELISINTFLPTIPNHQRALTILENSDISHDLKRVLFEINADPQLSELRPFSNITSLNYFTGIEVILFMAGTIFRPTDIHDQNGILVIQMEVCSDNHKTMKIILENMKAECYNGETNLLSFSNILLKMKRYGDSEKYYNRVLHDMPNDYHSVAHCYQGLGNVAMEKHDYDLSLEWYQKALDTNRLVLRSEDPEIASGYSIMADAYVKKGTFNEAYELYTQALQIWIRALGKDHPKVATCYKNMACVFKMEERYPEALEYFSKALAIREKKSSDHQLDVAKLHNYIADIYMSLNDMDQALKHYNSALVCLTKIYSSKHIDVLLIIRNIGLCYETLGDLNQALAHFEKVALKRRQLLLSDHSGVIQISDDIERVSSKLSNIAEF
ncbi:unnamed protein product [Adineta steineri]|uniref:Kinesin light chain n=1 Tax=Adineta steineri TaxID=433720 RepID=A0A819DHC0_9BILA|nr:unnamed protein product [Adineta steineri]